MASLSEGDEKSWFEYRQLILSELRRINQSLGELDAKIDRLRTDEISKLKVDVAMLQVKSGMWGALGGVAIAVGTYLLKAIGGP